MCYCLNKYNYLHLYYYSIIELIKVKEYYTSKKCPVCGVLNTPKGRNYICDCGYSIHRDVNGAINILNDNSNFKIHKYNTLKYLQIAQ